MINEANEPSSACRLWRTCQVETSTPPCSQNTIGHFGRSVKAGGWTLAGAMAPGCAVMRLGMLDRLKEAIYEIVWLAGGLWSILRHNEELHCR